MALALVLTEEKAAELGYSGSGPFTFGGVFPGEWTPGQPLRFDVLGFDSEAELRDRLASSGAPLEETTVDTGEGYPERVNHVASEMDVEAAQERVDFSKIRTHAAADEAAGELGFTFPEGVKLEDKVRALEAAREGATIDELIGTTTTHTGTGEETTEGEEG